MMIRSQNFQNGRTALTDKKERGLIAPNPISDVY